MTSNKKQKRIDEDNENNEEDANSQKTNEEEAPANDDDDSAVVVEVRLPTFKAYSTKLESVQRRERRDRAKAIKIAEAAAIAKKKASGNDMTTAEDEAGKERPSQKTRRKRSSVTFQFDYDALAKGLSDLPHYLKKIPEDQKKKTMAQITDAFFKSKLLVESSPEVIAADALAMLDRSVLTEPVYTGHTTSTEFASTEQISQLLCVSSQDDVRGHMFDLLDGDLDILTYLHEAWQTWMTTTETRTCTVSQTDRNLVQVPMWCKTQSHHGP